MRIGQRVRRRFSPFLECADFCRWRARFRLSPPGLSGARLLHHRGQSNYSTTLRVTKMSPTRQTVSSERLGVGCRPTRRIRSPRPSLTSASSPPVKAQKAISTGGAAAMPPSTSSSPEHVGEKAAARRGVTGGTTLDARGSNQAIDRAELVTVNHDGRQAQIWRPNLLGALAFVSSSCSRLRWVGGSCVPGTAQLPAPQRDHLRRALVRQVHEPSCHTKFLGHDRGKPAHSRGMTADPTRS